MLVNLCDYKQSVTLIANSGVQFLDFGLTPQDTASNGRFVRKTANGPLLRLDFDLVNGRYTLPATDGGQPEVVKPESTIPLHDSLTVLDGGRCRVTRGGVLTGHKSLTPEGTELHRPALCEADLADLAQAAALGVSAVMQPFVRSADDLRTVRQAMAENGLAHAELFAKVEDQTGLDALPDWMGLCDVVTIARGDLGSSLPLEQLPAAQKHIAALCRSRRKPFLVVTQLLHSMIDHPTPTRAEVLDIYNAVLDGADCLMLTGETAQGRYPLAALDWLMRVAQEAQRAR